MDKENTSYLFICISNNNINNWTFYIPIQHIRNKLFPYYRFIYQMKANLWFKCQIKRTRYFTIFPICWNYFILSLLQLLVKFKANGDIKNPLIKEHIFCHGFSDMRMCHVLHLFGFQYLSHCITDLLICYSIFLLRLQLRNSEWNKFLLLEDILDMRIVFPIKMCNNIFILDVLL